MGSQKFNQTTYGKGVSRKYKIHRANQTLLFYFPGNFIIIGNVTDYRKLIPTTYQTSSYFLQSRSV